MNSRWKNVGMYLSILTATSTALVAYSAASDELTKASVIITLVVTVAGIISNPKEGIGYDDKGGGVK